MNIPPVVVITTRLPPQVCGIGIYSWLLHRHWPFDSSQTQFLVVDGAAKSAAELGHRAISEFKAKPGKLSHELERVGAADVLLHYAGRAYHRYGCPAWLPAVLRNWKVKFPAGRLLVFFHELPGENFPVTTRYFWIDMCNRRVIGKLARLADVIATNTAEHVGKLEKISGRRGVPLIPVGSNIEPTNDDTERRARTEFAIFGLPFGRWQTLQMFDREIRSWQETGRLTKLHLIGLRDENFDDRSDQLVATWPDPGMAVRHGMLPSPDVSKLLARLQFGLTNATVENWSKSSAFMAYAAHGCAIVAKTKSELRPLCFTITPAEVPMISDVDLAERARLLKEWYDANADWNVIAGRIAALLSAPVEQEASK
jgi:hypothetical protein